MDTIGSLNFFLDESYIKKNETLTRKLSHLEKVNKFHSRSGFFSPAN